VRLFRFFLSEAWEMQARDRAGGLASLTALTAVLFLLAVVLLAGFNVRGAARTLEARKGLVVFLEDGMDPGRIEELAAAFESFGEVEEVRFVSQEEALREVEEDLDGADIVGAMGENPLSPFFRIELTPQAASRTGVVRELESEIGVYKGVEDVLSGGSWIESLEQGLTRAYWVTGGAGLLAGVAVLLVLWNTIKLAFLARRDTIRILKIVGATSNFIRSPFLLLGALHAGTASMLALLLAAVVRFATTVMMPGFRFFPPIWVALFLGGAILVGLLSSYASVEPALRGLERRHEPVTR